MLCGQGCAGVGGGPGGGEELGVGGSSVKAASTRGNVDGRRAVGRGLHNHNSILRGEDCTEITDTEYQNMYFAIAIPKQQ